MTRANFSNLLLMVFYAGTDIQLARGAVSVTSVSKEKGRYLLLLPGLMSLKNQTQPANTAASASAKPASKTASTNADSDDDDPAPEDNDKDTDNLEAETGNVETKNASPNAAGSLANTSNPSASGTMGNTNSVPLLGRLERLNTATPIFKIPFPSEPKTAENGAESGNGKKMLCFPGTKVETSSKFMILTCKKKQSGGGTVKCKV